MIPSINTSGIGSIRPVFLRPFWESETGGTISADGRSVSQDSAATALQALGFIKVPEYSKWYVEFECSDTGAFLVAAGVAFGIASEPVAAARSNAATTFVEGGVTSATQQTWTAGRLMMALDYAGKKAWFGHGGSWFSSGDPAADSNPYYSNMPAGDWRLWCHGDNDNNGVATVRIHSARSEMNYAPPTGFGVLG